MTSREDTRDLRTSSFGFWGVRILTSLAGQPVASKGNGLWTRVSGTQSRGLRYRLSSTVRCMKGTQEFTQSFRASLP